MSGTGRWEKAAEAYATGEHKAGRELELAQNAFDIPTMWAVFVLLGILGVALNTAFLIVERRVLAWHSGSRQST